MRTVTILAVYILLAGTKVDLFVQGNVRDFINRIFRRNCNAFVIHQSINSSTILLEDGMTIRPNEISQWEVEASCSTFFTFRVETMLTDKLTGEIIRVGIDRSRRNGKCLKYSTFPFISFTHSCYRCDILLKTFL